MVAAAIEVLARAAQDPEKRKVFGSTGGFPRHIFQGADDALATLSIADIEDEMIARALRIISLRLKSAADDVADFKEFSDDDEGGAHWAQVLAQRAQEADELYRTISDRVGSRGHV